MQGSRFVISSSVKINNPELEHHGQAGQVMKCDEDAQVVTVELDLEPDQPYEFAYADVVGL